jgi:copper transport protein
MLRRAAVALLVIGLAALMVGSDRALAHAGLVSSTPAASSVLETSPPFVVLDFDEDIDIPLTSIQLYDASGASIALGRPAEGADPSIVQSSVPVLGAGTYAVVWRVSSADGHVIDGAFSFQIGTASGVDAGALVDTVLHGARADPSVGRLLGLSRFTAFAGATLLLGGLFMILVLDGSSAPSWGARRLLWIGWVALLVGSAANFGLLGANALAGSVRDALNTSVWGRIADTRTGGLLLARLAFVVVLLLPAVLLAGRAAAGRAGPAWRIGVPLAGVLTVFTFSGSGHPSIERAPAIWIGVDALHLAFIFLWLGGLAMMAVGGRAWLRRPDHAVAVQRFSRMATIGVPIVVVTGVVQTWRIGGGFSRLTEGTWGRLLLAKGAIAVLVMTIGAASRWVLHNDGPRGLRHTVVTEAALGAIVLALAAGLVGSPPRVELRSRVYEQSLVEDGLIVDAAITPGQVGANEVHMVVTPPGGNLTASSTLTARLTLPSRDIPYVPVTIEAESPNHFVGNVTLPFPGKWTLEIVVSPTPAESVLFSSTVDIPDPTG